MLRPQELLEVGDEILPAVEAALRDQRKRGRRLLNVRWPSHRGERDEIHAVLGPGPVVPGEDLQRNEVPGCSAARTRPGDGRPRSVAELGAGARPEPLGQALLDDARRELGVLAAEPLAHQVLAGPEEVEREPESTRGCFLLGVHVSIVSRRLAPASLTREPDPPAPPAGGGGRRGAARTGTRRRRPWRA